MAPKKKPPQQKQKHAGKAGKSHGSSSKAAPKVQISAENERCLRRLLMNTERPAPAAAPDANEGISREQKARKLCGIYDKLSLEGFSSGQIERAVSAFAEGATFESALDWLCFNLPEDELPLKFSSTGSITTVHEVGERSMKVISRAQDDWVPTHPSNEINDETFGLSIRIKGNQEESLMNLGAPSQADWIRQYVKQQEDEEQEKEEKGKQLEKVPVAIYFGRSINTRYNLQAMALACLVCHSMDSPSRSFRSYSVSSSEGEGRCSVIVSCLTPKVNTSTNNVMTSKVTPFPMMTDGQGTAGNPRLIRSLAVTREHVRDWNFEEIALDG